MKMIEKWEVRLHSDDDEEYFYRAYESEEEAAEAANLINYDCAPDFNAKKIDQSPCFKRIKGAFLCRVRSYAFDGVTIGGFVNSLPTTQQEADKAYRELDFLMCDEVIYMDGEATYEQARASFNKNLLEAQNILRMTGFRPPENCDVFLDGELPEPMK